LDACDDYIKGKQHVPMQSAQNYLLFANAAAELECELIRPILSKFSCLV